MDQNRNDARQALAGAGGLLGFVALCSIVVNLLMLTGPLYMLNVYDRVLQARSVDTLVALTGIMVVLYFMLAVFDHLRGRVMARLAARVQLALDPPLAAAMDARGQKVADLDAVVRGLSGPGVLALFDLPWLPVFVAAIFLFHPVLGWFAVAAVVCLLAAAGLHHLLQRAPADQRDALHQTAASLGAQMARAAADLRAQGMAGAMQARWLALRAAGQAAAMTAADRGGFYQAGARAFRLFLQSAILGLGAFLVIGGDLSPGAMIAASIILARAIAPLDAVLAHGPLLLRAKAGWRNLTQMQAPGPVGRAAVPKRGQMTLVIDDLTLQPPGAGAPVLRNIAFSAHAGQAIGVIGPSGAGKTALARALTGIWPDGAGQIRLNGLPLGHYAPEALARQIGYLPQKVQFYPGRISDNIARMAPDLDLARVAQAISHAGADRVIASLPDGLDHWIDPGEDRLSGGETQILGLARALYGAPGIVVLDEPDAYLDHAGLQALRRAIASVTAAGGIAIVMAHRPAAIAACDQILVLDRGKARAFGPRDKVLADQLHNHAPVDLALRRAALAP